MISPRTVLSPAAIARPSKACPLPFSSIKRTALSPAAIVVFVFGLAPLWV